jgi:hypothetical protein
MRHLDASAVEAAERFVWLSGRLIDRHRFTHLFRGGPVEPVLAALRPYQNDDGGFAHALEPDLRGPVSQPQPVEVAFHVLDELNAFDDPMIGRACDYLITINTDERGVPFMLPSAMTQPRAPWWQTGDNPAASVNPTAAIAGLLHKHRVSHPWLEPATDFCWKRLDAMESAPPYDMKCILLFLQHAPDASRARAVMEHVRPLLTRGDMVAMEPGAEGEAFSPLDFAPAPESIGRGAFPDGVIDAHLDALVAAQGEDGGWPVPWPVWTPATGPEWRAWITIGALRTLRAYGRW